MEKLRILRNPLVWLWALPIGGLLLILVAFNGKVTPVKIGQPVINESAGEIQGDFNVGQTFYSPYPGLSRIDVLLATYGRTNSGPVTFNLTTSPGDKTKIFSTTFDASGVEDNQYYSFEFTSLSDSQGKTYFFYLEAPSAQAGNAITAWTDSRNPYTDGASYLGGRLSENDLAFVAAFDVSPWQVTEIFLGRLAKGKPGIWGSEAFYAATFVVYLALAGAFFFYLFRWFVVDKQDRP